MEVIIKRILTADEERALQITEDTIEELTTETERFIDSSLNDKAKRARRLLTKSHSLTEIEQKLTGT